MNRKKSLLITVVVFAQFACTSLWFAGNAIVPLVADQIGVHKEFVASVTSATQIGFIIGTFVFAVLGIADRFDSRKVFLSCAFLAAVTNLTLLLTPPDQFQLLITRLIVGFLLAGIYPVGMKIAADISEKGLGLSLAFLVGALVLGTASPHLFTSLLAGYSWKFVIASSSLLSFVGGALILILPKVIQLQVVRISPGSFFYGFRSVSFRAFSFGYFGHMWELYTFWAFVPIIIEYNRQHVPATNNISLLSFLVVGIGAIGCVVGGLLSQRFGEARVAFVSLLCSFLCCLVSPFVIVMGFEVFFPFMIFWGLVVIADSPLFSSLVARNIDPQLRGSALTIVVCIGFALTVVSLMVTKLLTAQLGLNVALVALAVGPLIGLMAFRRFI